MKSLLCALMLCLAVDSVWACDVVVGSVAVAIVEPRFVAHGSGIALATPTVTFATPLFVATQPVVVQAAPVIVERRVVVRRNRLLGRARRRR